MLNVEMLETEYVEFLQAPSIEKFKAVVNKNLSLHVYPMCSIWEDCLSLFDINLSESEVLVSLNNKKLDVIIYITKQLANLLMALC